VLVLAVVFLILLRDDGPESHAKDDLDARLKRLRSLPYTTVTDHEADPGSGGVRIHDRDRVHPGYNIFVVYDSSLVRLMDMDGEVVHEWSYPEEGGIRWRHARMLDSGDLFAIEKFISLTKLNWDSEVLWKQPLQIHHEIVMLPDSTLLAMVREMHDYRNVRVRFPAIVYLTPAGEEIERWSSYDHLNEIKSMFDQTSFFDTVLDALLAKGDSLEVFAGLGKNLEMRWLKPGTKFYDYFHLNTITPLPATPLGEEDPRFREGNLLICFRNVNQIAVLDKDTREILWTWGEGVMEWPHHPTMLKNGNILVFDNGVERRYSQVLEVDPVSEKIVWQYVGDPPSTFYTYSKGSAQRFPNGNTLICEGDAGRIFEVTRKGEIVWEWINPVLREGRRGQVYRMIRLELETVEPLLERDRAGPDDAGRDAS